jgi:hypothetical protein
MPVTPLLKAPALASVHRLVQAVWFRRYGGDLLPAAVAI